MKTTTFLGKNTEDQWSTIPDELKELYTRSTESLYNSPLPVETVAQKEANIYNSLFGGYGLFKPVKN